VITSPRLRRRSAPARAPGTSLTTLLHFGLRF
jgi:hypothetical protein